MKKYNRIFYLSPLLVIFFAYFGSSTQIEETSYTPLSHAENIIFTCRNRLFSPTAHQGKHPEYPQADTELLDDQGRPLYKQGEILVRFKNGVPDGEKDALHKALGSNLIDKLSYGRIDRVKVRTGLSETEAVHLYASSPIVDFVERHALRYTFNIPNDPFFKDQWALTRISASSAWGITRCEASIIIAVIDTGVDYHHPDLLENIWMNPAELNGVSGLDDDGNGYVDDVLGWDFADEDPYPLDVDGHGTHVAGVIAAVGNNGLGTTGVCWNAKLMALKVQADGLQEIEIWAVIRAIHYAINHGARIVNCSFGSSVFSTLEYEAFGDLKDAGILAVCAAGNRGVDSDIPGQEIYPASYNLDNIIAVTASTRNDTIASFSNFGLKSVDIAAPGVNIKSTLPTLTSLHGLAVVQGKSRSTANDIHTRYESPAVPILYNKRVEGICDKFEQNGGASEEWGDLVLSVSISKADTKNFGAVGRQAIPLGNEPISIPSNYGLKSGTSFAAAHVSGVAGIILSKTPHLNSVQLKAAILNTVDDLPAFSEKIASGGRVNALAALCSTNTVPADFSFDHILGLEDAIILFQILSGRQSPTPICSVSLSPALDTNGDGTFGIEEIIYILQDIAGLKR